MPRQTLTAAAACLVLALLCQPAAAGSSPAEMIRLASPGQKVVPATLDDAAWLVGSWQGRMYDMTVEHVVLPEKLDHMPGFVRAVGDTAGEVAFYEISVLVETEDGTIANRVKHFTHDLAGWEGQAEFIERRLVELGDDVLYFDGITFEKIDADSFMVYFLEQGGPNEGNILVIEFTATGGQPIN